METNCTAFLVRSLASGWKKGSLMAVDAGVHLGAITRILEETQPPDLGKTDEFALPYILKTGPFAGLKVHSASAKTNAGKIQGDLIDTYLITHPHLDHISGFVINTAGLAGPRRKKLAGLPGTIQALKTHIFNNVIWPNLSDEDNGAGLFTYMRLNEGGSPAMGNIDGYLEFSEGLAVKVWSVSHGHNIEKQPHRGSGSNTRYGSLDATSGPMLGFNTGMLSPRSIAHHNASPGLASFFQQHQMSLAHERANSMLPGSGAASGVRGSSGIALSGGHSPVDNFCVYDSSSYFIRDVDTGIEVLIFGDVEADSISMHPRNLNIWQEAAPKIVMGTLKAILIECSYDDSRPVDRLFGHLTPSFLIQELTVLADEVKGAKARIAMDKDQQDNRRGSKRKRDTHDESTLAGRRRVTRAALRDSHSNANSTGPAAGGNTPEPVSPRTIKGHGGGGSVCSGSQPQLQRDSSAGESSTLLSQPVAQLSLRGELERTYTASSNPSPGSSVTHPPGAAAALAAAQRARVAQADVPQLGGIKVVIIHMKDTMDDEPPIGQNILEELNEHEADMDTPLGCEWVISEVGQSLFL